MPPRVSGYSIQGPILTVYPANAASTAMRKERCSTNSTSTRKNMWFIYFACLSEQDQASKLPPPRSILLAPTFTPLH